MLPSKNYHYISNNTNNINNTNLYGNFGLRNNGSSSLNKEISNPIYNQYQNNKDKFNTTNNNMFGMQKNLNDRSSSMNSYNVFNNTNKFNSNLNANVNNLQERVINFGQDQNENSFKRTLRKPTVSNLYTANFTSNYQPNPLNNPQSFSQVKYEKPGNKIEEIFLSYKAANVGRTSQALHQLKAASHRDNVLYGNGMDTYEKMEKGGNDYSLNAIIGTPNVVMSANNSPKIGLNTPKNSNSAKNIETYNMNPFNTFGKGNGNGPTFDAFTYDKSYMRNNTDSGYYIKDAFSVREFAYFEDCNVRFREAMEDYTRTIDKFMNEKDKGLFTLYDGHGGAECARYARERLPIVLEKLLNVDITNPNNVENAITAVFAKVDEELKFDAEHVGCTATVAYITKEKDYSSFNNPRRVAYVANVGDSRCVLVTSYGAKRMSYDHKASDPSEINRINNSGGIIFNGRVFGQLILTRAIGDNALKKYGVITTPYLSKYFIQDRDKYLILASDGVWDVVSDEDTFRFANMVNNSDELAKLIVKNSLVRGSMDNISCIVIKLN